ncbi:Elongator complex protein 4 [Limtongia smithiae]|uniref:Elongator complex protein 4 n=1 Tax=Limtongia smithiae TaxID=1125753 RepID=UPI0034CF36B5
MSFRKRNEPITPRSAIPSSTQSLQLPSATSAARPSRTSSTSPWSFSRPSTLLPRHETVSTGTASLDKLLLHGGIPLGTSLLILEEASTDFAAVPARCYAAQGVANGEYVITVTSDDRWAARLPAAATSKSREQQSTPSAAAASTTSDDLRIAWRYRTLSKPASTAAASDKSFCGEWNITANTSLTPSVNMFLHIPPPTRSFSEVIARISSALAATDKCVRLVLPNFLSPPAYNPACVFAPTELLRFLHSIRALLRAHPSRLSVLLTLSAALFDEGENGVLMPWITTLVDGVIKLIPANMGDESANSSERIQGFVNIVKIPILSDRGDMLQRSMEYAFKIDRAGMKIEKWGIPVALPSATQESKPKADSLEF